MSDIHKILSDQQLYWLVEVTEDRVDSLFGNAIVLTRDFIDTMYFTENIGIIRKKNIVEEFAPSENELAFFEYCRKNKEFPLTKELLRKYDLLSYVKEKKN